MLEFCVSDMLYQKYPDLHEGELTVPMLTTDAVWFGVTYKEDKPFVQAELRKLHESGVYPASLHE